MALASVVFGGAVVFGGSMARAQALAPPFPPFENQVTPQKAVLGKALFWDEQLSSDNTMACGSCHQPKFGGADPRTGIHPGPDSRFGTPDDRRGSPGIVGSAANGDYQPAPPFGLAVQVTARTTPTNIGAAYFPALRWDGKATDTFVDPQTRRILIMLDGALENHSIGPPTDAHEMAYAGRDWTAIANKIASSRPLALATNLPADLRAALAGNPDYGELMRRAFGTRAVNSQRIIYALATYQRTLVPDQTPWDALQRGNQSALTAAQKRGWNLFENQARCFRCHLSPLFSDTTFRNLGLRPVGEDIGWQLATSDPADRGKFKVPTLRNAGLRNRYMHNGQFTSLTEVVDFYSRGGGPFTGNKDRDLAVLNLTAAQKSDLIDFVQNALTDPRVAAETAPFDRPTLYAERVPQPFGATLAGAGNIAPRPLAARPWLSGDAGFRIGIADGLGGAPALMLLAGAKGPTGQKVGLIPVHLAITPALVQVPVTLRGSGTGNGYATVRFPIPTSPVLVGRNVFAQWFVADAASPAGISASTGVGDAVLK